MYKTLKEVVEAAKNHRPEDGEFRTIVDNDRIVVSIHPGWDEDGEELGDPEYLYSEDPGPMIIEALNLLGLNAEGA